MNEIEASSDLRFRNLKDKQELGKEKACYCELYWPTVPNFTKTAGAP